MKTLDEFIQDMLSNNMGATVFTMKRSALYKIAYCIRILRESHNEWLDKMKWLNSYRTKADLGKHYADVARDVVSRMENSFPVQLYESTHFIGESNRWDEILFKRLEGVEAPVVALYKGHLQAIAQQIASLRKELKEQGERAMGAIDLSLGSPVKGQHKDAWKKRKAINEANACLIAAAPELLEALEALEALIQNDSPLTGNPVTQNLYSIGCTRRAKGINALSWNLQRFTPYVRQGENLKITRKGGHTPSKLANGYDANVTGNPYGGIQFTEVERKAIKHETKRKFRQEGKIEEHSARKVYEEDDAYWNWESLFEEPYDGSEYDYWDFLRENEEPLYDPRDSIFEDLLD